MVMVDSKLPGSRSITRAVIGRAVLNKPKLRRRFSSVFCAIATAASFCFPRSSAIWARSRRLSRFRLPESMSPLHQSPTGRATALVARWIGDTIVWASLPAAPNGPVRPLRLSRVMSVRQVSTTSASTKRRRFALRGLAIARGPARLLLGRAQDALEHVEVLEALPGALHDGVEGVGCDDDRHTGLRVQPVAQAVEER